MKNIDVIQVISEYDRNGRYVFNKHDLRKLFIDDKSKAFDQSLQRLVQANILQRACRGIYVNQNAISLDSYAIENIATTLRRGEYNYVSLESILAEFGIISQAPVDRLTIMTTGRSGIYQTPYGVIEFTHTKRHTNDILANTERVPSRPLRIASKKAAIRDLKRVGRNVDLLQEFDNE